MTPLRLRLAGLGDLDRKAVISMLRLSADQLKQPWVLSEEEDADLVLFALDTETGKQAWRQRGAGLTALLTNSGSVAEPVDIVLKKPLRKTSFAEALNLARHKIRTRQSAAVARQPDPQDQVENGAGSGMLSSLLGALRLRRQADRHLPPLYLPRPDTTGNPADTITDPDLLPSWLDQLPADTNQRVATLVSNLQLLNRVALKPARRLALLELYRPVVRQSLFSRDVSAVKRDLQLSSESQRVIRSCGELVNALATGYLAIVSHFYHRGDAPGSSDTMLLCLNRATEWLALSVLHAFHYYRSAPADTWSKLHEFHLYQEQAGTLQREVKLKQGYESDSFQHLYGQILLTALADPYSLARFDVFRLFRQMGRFTRELVIRPMDPKLVKVSSSFLLTGHYCIDCHADMPATRMIDTPLNVRSAPHTRLLDLQQAVRAIEAESRRAEASQLTSADLELRLLKQVIPKLNTTVDRRYHRIDTGKNRHVEIALGLRAIHRHINGQQGHAQPWQLANQSSGGVMARRDSEGCPALDINDLVAVFEDDLPARMALIKWLHIDGETQVGLEYLEGTPLAVYCMPDGEPEQHAALLLTQDAGKTLTMLTEKGLFSPRRRLRVKNAEAPFVVEAGSLLMDTLDYEQFSYRLKPGS